MYYVYGIGTFDTHGTRTFDSVVFLSAKVGQKNDKAVCVFIALPDHVPLVSVGDAFHSSPDEWFQDTPVLS